MFSLELERLKDEVRASGAGKVLIQLPFGLRPYAIEIAKAVAGAGGLPIVQADPCYGACDVATWAASTLGAELIAHYGHSKMLELPSGPAVIYLEARMDIDVREALEKALSLLEPYSTIGLATTVQHIHAIGLASSVLKEAGHDVRIGRAGGLVAYDGQILGCDFTTLRAIRDQVDAILVIGSKFHAIGASIATGKPTVMANPYECIAEDVSREAARVLARRYASIQEARGARSFGVIVGLKPGQMKLQQAIRALELLREAEKEAILLAANEVRPEYLADFTCLDALVNTACPRLSLEDDGSFGRPLLTFLELKVALGLMEWEELCRAGWFAAPGS